MDLSRQLAVIDVETTGLYSSDSIVTLGQISVDPHALRNSRFDVQTLHLIFDLGKKSHKRATEVHGWHDWTLRHYIAAELVDVEPNPALICRSGERHAFG